ncbi:MAG: oxygen-independent coproporphyrinogen III oxidase [Spirochaetia bacterium]|nr:oxygen-independent coproporphyrinogen III oxidase [Spirochaetia bacterium]
MNIDSNKELNDKTILRLITKYNTPVPRYTSYPTAVEFRPDFKENIFFKALSELNPENSISVYIHIPFCENRCLYCGCNVLVSRKREIADIYINYLIEEIKIKLESVKFKPKVSQLHFGGGTPNYLTLDLWKKLVKTLKESFIFNNDIEWSVELDPMACDINYLNTLQNLGINRVSFGVQDVNRKTQEAVNRIQDMNHINSLIDHCRKLKFDSVNIDFIYGLPHQTYESFKENIKWIDKYRPDRIAIFSYAHIPWIKKHQNKMPLEALTTPEEKLKIYLGVQKDLKKAGYRQIGMDHYALPEDPLSLAQEDYSLHRNFMGYTTQANLAMLAFGASSISEVNGVFAQNHNKLKAYKNSITEKKDWFEKGLERNEDDEKREEIIQSIMNNFRVNIKNFEKKWNVDFQKKYLKEYLKLKELSKEGLVNISNNEINVTELGRYIVRHIAKTFDAYRHEGEKIGFSKGI